MRNRRWFLRLTMLAIVLALTIGTFLMHTIQISSVVAVQSSIESYKPFVTGLRLVVISFIAYAWPKVIQNAQQSGRISKERRTQLLAQRWRMVGWLLIIEVVLGQNLVPHLLTAINWAGV